AAVVPSLAPALKDFRGLRLKTSPKRQRRDRPGAGASGLCVSFVRCKYPEQRQSRCLKGAEVRCRTLRPRPAVEIQRRELARHEAAGVDRRTARRQVKVPAWVDEARIAEEPVRVLARATLVL